MKSYYFRSKEILSTTIYQEVKFFIDNYNNFRPCYKHRIYTPSEVHANPELANVKLVLEKSNQKRLKENRKFCCKMSAQSHSNIIELYFLTEFYFKYSYFLLFVKDLFPIFEFIWKSRTKNILFLLISFIKRIMRILNKTIRNFEWFDRE